MIKLQPGCKVNFGLKIIARRANGYHDIETIFYPLASPHDELVLIKNSTGRLKLYCDTSFEQENILYKVYSLYKNKSGHAPGAEAILKKGIPHGAGLGGGSSDAACFLLWLNQHSENRLEEKEILNMAADIGADVPFFIKNAPAFAEGIGEIITPVTLKKNNFFLVLVCPKIIVNTGYIFKEYDIKMAGEKNALTKQKLKDNTFFSINIEDIDFTNELEETVFKLYPGLSKIKQNFFNMNASHAAMSGSGSAIYGIYYKKKDALAAYDFMKQQFENVFLLSG